MDFTTLLSGLLASLTNIFFKADTVVVNGLTAIALGIPEQEVQIVKDALASLKADLDAGKGAGEAAADMWTTFYSEEKTEFSAVGKAIVNVFVTALTAAGAK